MQVSVIIPSMKGREAMLQKLLSTIPDEYEKIVVDDENLLLAAKRNKGARQAKGQYLLFIDDDNYLAPDAIEAALQLAERTGIGVVGLMACYDDKKYLIADGGSKRNYLTGFTKGINTNRFWLKAFKDGPYEVDEIANAFMMHSVLFFELNGFDEKNFPIDLDEADFCKRAKNTGLKIMMCQAARCFHKSQTYSHIPNFRREKSAYFLSRNIVLYQRKHLNALSFGVFVAFFLPIRVCFYLFALVRYQNFQMILPMMKGYFDGIINRRENKYQ